MFYLINHYEIPIWYLIVVVSYAMQIVCEKYSLAKNFVFNLNVKNYIQSN